MCSSLCSVRGLTRTQISKPLFKRGGGKGSGNDCVRTTWQPGLQLRQPRQIQQQLRIMSSSPSLCLVFHTLILHVIFAVYISLQGNPIKCLIPLLQSKHGCTCNQGCVSQRRFIHITTNQVQRDQPCGDDVPPRVKPLSSQHGRAKPALWYGWFE